MARKKKGGASPGSPLDKVRRASEKDERSDREHAHPRSPDEGQGHPHPTQVAGHAHAHARAHVRSSRPGSSGASSDRPRSPRVLPLVPGSGSVPEEHRRGGPTSVGCAVVTVSDSKTDETDRGGPAIRASLERAGHEVAWSRVVRDEAPEIRASLEAALADGKVHAAIFTGGTGIARRDVTVEALRPSFDKELPGFGELFRYLSWKQVGSAAMLSRACAGIVRGKAVFLLPGSPDAVTLAMDELVVRELGHVAGLLAR